MFLHALCIYLWSLLIFINCISFVVPVCSRSSVLSVVYQTFVALAKSSQRWTWLALLLIWVRNIQTLQKWTSVQSLLDQRGLLTSARTVWNSHLAVVQLRSLLQRSVFSAYLSWRWSSLVVLLSTSKLILKAHEQALGQQVVWRRVLWVLWASNFVGGILKKVLLRTDVHPESFGCRMERTALSWPYHGLVVSAAAEVAEELLNVLIHVDPIWTNLLQDLTRTETASVGVIEHAHQKGWILL